MLTADRVKLSLAMLILASGVGGYYYFGSKPDAIRILMVLAGAIVAMLVASQTGLGRATWGFGKGSLAELRRVVWPTRKETVQVTIAVVVMVILTAVFLWVVDYALILGIKAVTGQGS